VVATFFRRDIYDRAGVPQGLDRAARACASLRIMGSGGIELGWVAAGRLDGWVQSQPQPWDWLAGSLLVREAGGACREGVGAAGWALAGPASVVEALAGVLEAG
jgi:fructose-1,6-bisphosphatase/inositol monophosphatase family enzyme